LVPATTFEAACPYVSPVNSEALATGVGTAVGTTASAGAGAGALFAVNDQQSKKPTEENHVSQNFGL
jgi:hypothetical protein